jgi:glycerophosphoryl diester phosphodiesterase
VSGAVAGAGGAGVRRLLVLSHRGDARDGQPENTVGAFLAGLAVPGCDGVEFDVRAARDGTPVIAHDETLLRVFGDPRRVGDLSTAELAALGVPTLRELLAALPARAFLDVELKEDVGAAAVPILRAGRGPDLANAVVSSFDTDAIRTVRSLAPAWPTWLGVMALDADAVARAVALGCRGIAAGHESITAATVAAAGRAGLEVAAWTGRTRETLARLAALDVVAACVEEAALDHALEDLGRAVAGGAPAAAVDPGSDPALPRHPGGSR